MKIIWVLLGLIGSALAEKLDRSYLPPPGSKFSGGSPGAIDVPLEFPKETVLPNPGSNNLGKPEIAIGINRISPIAFNQQYGSTSEPYQKNEYNSPATESYALSEISTKTPDVVSNDFVQTPNLGDLKINYEKLYQTSSTTKPGNLFSVIEETKYINNGGDLTDDNNYETDNKISDESKKIYGGDIDSIPEINSYFAKPSSPAAFDFSLSKLYETGANVSSTPTYDSSSNLSESLYSTKQPQYGLKPDAKTTFNIPYTYSPRTERIQAQRDREAVILNYDSEITPDGYAYSFDTSNGIHVDEKATALNGVRATGSYSYIGDDGKLYNVSYTADENGFRPIGDHLPSPPPIPNAIMKVIEQATKDRDLGIFDDGTYDDSKYGYRNYEPKNKIGFLNKYKTGDPKYIKKQTDQKEIKNKKILSNKKEMGDKLITKDSIFTPPVTTLLPYEEDRSKSNYDEFENENINDSENEGNILSNESDGTGYEYSKPLDDFSLVTDKEFVNRISEIPNLNTDRIIAEKTNGNIRGKPFMTPYVYENDNTFLDYDNSESVLETLGQYQVQNKNIPSVQNTNTVLPTFSISELNSTNNISGDTGITNILPQDHQGYFYPTTGSNFNSDAYNPIAISSEKNISENQSTIPREFPSRLNLQATKVETVSSNPSPYRDYGLFNDESKIPNDSTDVGEKRMFIQQETTQPSDQNSYGEYISVPANELNDTEFTINRENAIKGEDFSGPKQRQKYDPLTGYYY
ncbi:uncharacterized protein LOC116772167 [Danaus plexippus]|uniref:uncharacterized protein LOC116772167 n=1 Tax=Danaus plexippus TaxID=13037 RepID=UPI002AB159AC|nr:uncharacterized protein LOC116772167 [Danaus plexippus]